MEFNLEEPKIFIMKKMGKSPKQMKIDFDDNLYAYSAGYDYVGIVVAKDAREATRLVQVKYPNYDILVTENDIVDCSDNCERVYEIAMML